MKSTERIIFINGTETIVSHPNRIWLDSLPKNIYTNSEDKEIDCDCHMFVGGSGEPCPDCKKNGCGFCKSEDSEVKE